MAHEDERQLKRQSPDCTDPATPDTCAVNSPVPYRRLPDPCGDVVLPDPCVPGAFVAPPGIPYVAPTPPTTLPFVFVFNAEQVAHCSDLIPTPGGTVIGVDVTVLAEALSTGVPVSVVTDVTPTQRQTLAALDQPTLDGFVDLTALQIAEAAGFSLAQATELKAAIDAEIEILNTQALSQALAALDCYYQNTQQTASCPEDSSTSPVVVSAGVVTSYASQEDADAQALDQAQAVLRCEWENDEQVATCAVGATGGSPTSSTVNAGSVISAVSKADANAQALAQAQSQIVCLYPNTIQVVTCSVDVNYVAADVTANNPITIAAGTILSAVSVADANDQATVAAQLLLQCQWSNTLQTAVVCPTSEGAAASATASPVYSVRPAAGSFISTLSRADANALALAFATAQLDCRYCNTLIEALCDDPVGSDDATAAVLAGSFCESTYGAAQSLATALAAIPIKIQVTGTPTCHYTNDRITSGCVGTDGDYAVYKFSTGTVSSGSSGTVTVEAGSVTSVVSKADANAQAKALALAFLNCFFDSAEASTVCGAGTSANSYPPVGSPFTAPVGFFTSYASQEEADNLRDAYLASILNCFFDSAEASTVCGAGTSANSYPPYGTPLVVPVGFFTSYTSQAEANNLRDAYIASILNCFFDSAEASTVCGAGTSANSYPPVGSPFTAPVGFFTSYTSQEEADNLRDAYLASVTNCFFDSAEASTQCANGTSASSYPPYGTPLVVPVGFFTSYTSQAEANNLRDAYIASILNCFFDSAENTPLACPADAATGSYPPNASPLTLAVGLFTSYTSQEEADNLRDAYLASVTNCFWTNVATTKWCDATDATEAITPKNAVIPANTLISLVSKADANALAAALATASLACFYTNDAKTGAACGAGITQLQSGVVAAGTLTAGSKASANSLAQTLANALNVCVANTFLITLGGAQGPAGNCDTPCGAFYA